MSKFDFAKIFSRAYKALWLVAVILVLLLIFMFAFSWKTDAVEIKTNENIGGTPITIERMRQIGEWEFLAVSDEEMVDTVVKRLLSKDELIRVYYGELHLGIDMKELADDAITHQGDTVVVNLPEIKLLDENFIDEARTKTFYESGSWNADVLEKLYDKAKRQMKSRCMTKENLATARENAESSVEAMLISLGVENFIVNAR